MALTYALHGTHHSPLPHFDLPATNGRRYSSADLKNGKPVVVMFLCNHCPYVKAIELRLIDLAKRYQDRAHFVAICSNDATDHPEDSFLELKAKAELMQYPFVYLHDEDQTVAKAFGAVCTPDLYIYNQKSLLCYRGRLDDSWKDASKVHQKELESALIETLNGKDISSTEQNPSMGCSIKWK